MLDGLIAFKNQIIQDAMVSWLNTKYGGYGRMISLKLDSHEKTISGEVLLKGESSAIQFNGKYEIHKGQCASFIQFRDVTLSREWLNLIVTALPPERLRIPLESGIGSQLVSMVL